MRIISADCEVTYTGRGNTTLARGDRAIIIKNDGSIGIHNEVGNKPMNYMGKGCVHTEEEEDGVIVWRFDSKKEYIEIIIHEIHDDVQMDVDNSIKLVRDGTENDLQAWLLDHPETIFGEDHNIISGEREYQTSAGPIDLMFFAEDGSLRGVEVKRVAMLTAVDQCSRYIEALKSNEKGLEVDVTLVALDVRPNTARLASQRKIPFVIVPEDWREGEECSVE